MESDHPEDREWDTITSAIDLSGEIDGEEDGQYTQIVRRDSRDDVMKCLSAQKLPVVDDDPETTIVEAQRHDTIPPPDSDYPEMTTTPKRSWQQEGMMAASYSIFDEDDHLGVTDVDIKPDEYYV